MRIHKEGEKIIPIATLIVTGLWMGLFVLLRSTPLFWLSYILAAGAVVLIGLIINFFRNPRREIRQNPHQVLSPCDGKVVIIEKVMDKEFFHKEMLQVSIFMSPLNVHVNRNPIAGKVRYLKYYPGKYLVAWHPKSSSLNEHTYVVLENETTSIAYKQIAGAVARRICYYIREGETVQQGAEMGFIRFGSRMDILLPVGTEVTVGLEQKVRGGLTQIAVLP